MKYLGRLVPVIVCILAFNFNACANEKFSFKDEAGKYLDILSGDKIIGRYMYAYDKSTPEKRNETYKTYLHVFSAEGTAPITKGAGGDFTHHRGIFIGWSKIAFNGKSYDRWHMNNGEQIHQKFSAQKADDSCATFTSLVNWTDETGRNIVEEERTMSFQNPPAPAYVLIDFTSKITAPNGDVALSGDPEHAGIQYRPANEVDRKTTKYVFPGANTDPKKDKDLAWAGETYTLNGKQYSAVIFNHPGNPKDTKCSAYRNYGRFGMFPVTSIKAGESFTFKYRFLVAEGPMPSAELIQKIGNQFTGASDPTPEITEKPADK